MRLSLRRAGRTILIFALGCAIATGGTGAATASIGSTGDADTSYLLDGVVGELTDTLDETTDELEETTDTLEETTNETTDGLEETTNETTGTLEETTNETTGTLEETTNETTGTLEETTGGTTDPLTEPTNSLVGTTTDVVEGTAETVGWTLEATTNGIVTTVDSTTEFAGSTLDALESAVVGAVEIEVSTADDPRSTADAGESDDLGPGYGDVGAGVSAVLAGLLGLTALSSATGAGAGGAAGASTGLGSWPGRVARALNRVVASLPGELFPFSILRYSRYDDSDPLDHDGRRSIYEAIDDDPGLYLSAVSERTDTPLSTVRHHVRVLEDEGVLTSARVNGKRRYVPAADGNVELYAALDDDAKRRVLEALASIGPAPNARLADELDVDPSTASHHLSRLEEDGLVERERDGRSIVTRLTPSVESTLVRAERAESDRSTPAPADD